MKTSTFDSTTVANERSTYGSKKADGLRLLILPAQLSPGRLMDLVVEQLDSPATGIDDPVPKELGALHRITRVVVGLLGKKRVERLAEPVAKPISLS